MKNLTITAVGVADPKAQGHAMTNTEMENSNVSVQSLNPCLQYGQSSFIPARVLVFNSNAHAM